MGPECSHGAGRTEAQHQAPVGFHFHFGYFMKYVILGIISFIYLHHSL